jgi:hypothetical protein
MHCEEFWAILMKPTYCTDSRPTHLVLIIMKIHNELVACSLADDLACRVCEQVVIAWNSAQTVILLLLPIVDTRVYPKVSGLAAWSENCKWYSSLPLGAVVSLFCESL